MISVPHAAPIAPNWMTSRIEIEMFNRPSMVATSPTSRTRPRPTRTFSAGVADRLSAAATISTATMAAVSGGAVSPSQAPTMSVEKIATAAANGNVSCVEIRVASTRRRPTSARRPAPSSSEIIGRSRFTNGSVMLCTPLWSFTAAANGAAAAAPRIAAMTTVSIRWPTNTMLSASSVNVLNDARRRSASRSPRRGISGSAGSSRRSSGT